MTRGIPALAALAVAAVAGCSGVVPTGSESPTTHSTSTPMATPSPTASGLVLPEPARPFDADTLLAAMRDSRRPGGVPDELESDAVASALADAIWTFDGLPWATLSAGGSCGPQTCTLEVGGAHRGAPGEDLWVFSVTPADGSVEVASADLRSLPDDMIAPLDELARSVHPSPGKLGLVLTSVRWLPPPDDGRFVLSYRSGEEGGCGVEVTLDAVAKNLVSDRVVEC